MRPLDELSDTTERRIGIVVLIVLLLLGLGVGTFDVDVGPDYPGINLRTPTPDGDGIPDDGTPVVRTPTPTPTPTPTGPSGGASGGIPTPGEGTSSGDSQPGQVADPSTSPTPSVPDGGTNEPLGSGDGVDSNDGSGDRTGDVDLEIRGNAFRIQVANVLPGDGGSQTLLLANAGNSSGYLESHVDVGDSENSLAEPEREARDDAESGELSSELLVRLSVARDGTREYLFGSADRYVPLESVEGVHVAETLELEPGEELTARFEWRLPKSAGNTVQTDVAVFRTDLFLRPLVTGL